MFDSVANELYGISPRLVWAHPPHRFDIMGQQRGILVERKTHISCNPVRNKLLLRAIVLQLRVRNIRHQRPTPHSSQVHGVRLGPGLWRLHVVRVQILGLEPPQTRADVGVGGCGPRVIGGVFGLAPPRDGVKVHSAWRWRVWGLERAGRLLLERERERGGGDDGGAIEAAGRAATRSSAGLAVHGMSLAAVSHFGADGGASVFMQNLPLFPIVWG